MARARVFQDKAEDLLPRLPADSFDSIVCDPPYGLAELPTALVVKALTEWLAGNRMFVPDGRGGFMGKDWDKFVPPPAAWDECYRVLKPGGHMLVFAGARTAGLMDISIRLAGFEVRDSLMWCFGSGFPKSRDIGKAIDKANGNPLAFREFARAYADAVSGSSLTHADIDEHLGIKASSCYWAREDHRGGMPPRHHWDRVRDLLGLDGSFGRLYAEAEREVIEERTVVQGGGTSLQLRMGERREVCADITAPATEAAQQWAGWGTALKPAHEPIILARKPLSEGTVAANVLRWGTGALNVDGCKVGSEARTNNAGGVSSLQRVSRVEQGYRQTVTTSEGQASETAGRWPPNLLLTHSADCRPAGTRRVKAAGFERSRPPRQTGAVYGEHQDSGFTSRADADGTETVQAFTCAPDCPVAGLDAQSGTLTSGANPSRRGSDKSRNAYGDFTGQRECTPQRGVDTGGASRFFPQFTWSPEYDLPYFYCAKAPKKERPRIVTDDGRVIQHCTVKPLTLMRWLVRLVTPPGGTVGDFFTGTGPVVQAALDEGMRCVACDQDPDSVALSRVRLAPYAGVRFTVPEPAEQPAAEPAEAECG